MSLLRYEPWALHRELINEFNRAYERNADASSGATADWAPAVDIEEYADRFVLHADVPGIDPATIEITLEKGVLTLSGSREQAVEQNGVERRRQERAVGKFLRRFVLPDTADADAVSASGKHGVLQVVIPKRAQAQPRKITVTH
ncbi:Hsp20/alpha crystallin family protein [Solimonas variicoloris]|uniref:Hsp20/alpha crystallin family protein n=1 Tax=Solimonas variicoloris TaxID=254408 RepID=UPI00037AD392|nr:Hsp20/alpha crystallin family protein [Solimonas variicoloris]